MSDTKGLTRQQMADRMAYEFQNGWIVNLGVGIPTMCSNTDLGDVDFIYHSENGIIGYGPVAPAGEEDLLLVNAGGQNVTMKPGASVVHHADSFGIIRGGHIDATVMGAYQVSMNGDFANWKLKGQKGGGIGGAVEAAPPLDAAALRVQLAALLAYLRARHRWCVFCGCAYASAEELAAECPGVYEEDHEGE